MKRLWITLAVVALAAIVALPAAAMKPPTPPVTPTTTEPPAVPSCESGPLPVAAGINNFECEWTPQEIDSTVGTVTVEVDSGAISGLVIFVVDSYPGNICVLEQINKPTNHESVEFPLREADGTTYWNTGGTDWCAQYDGSPQEDLNGPALHIRVVFRAKKGTVVNASFLPVDVADTQ